MCDPFCNHPAFLAKAILTLLGTLPTSVHLMSRSCPNSVIQSIQDNNPVVGQWICKSFCMDRQRYMQVANSNIWRNLAGNYYICKRHMWTTHWFNSNDCTWPHDYVTWHWDMYPDLLRPSLLKLQCFFSCQPETFARSIRVWCELQMCLPFDSRGVDTLLQKGTQVWFEFPAEIPTEYENMMLKLP